MHVTPAHVAAVSFLSIVCVCLGAGPKAGTPKPGITEQPIGRIATEGSPVAISVTATGATTLSFQWWKGTQVQTNNTRFSGATNAVLNIDPVLSADVGDYSVVVSSAGGSVTSSVASLVVPQIPPPQVVALGSTGILVSISGVIGDVYRVERSVDWGAWTTNGYTTNTTGVARFVTTTVSGFLIRYRAGYERLLPLLHPPPRTNGTPTVRAYGKLNEGWRFESTTNFAQWDLVATVTNLTGWTAVADTNAGPACRFYRITKP